MVGIEMMDAGEGAAAPASLDLDTMRDALMADPDWVRRDSELMARLAGDETSGAVIDFGAAARARLLEENRRLKAARVELANNARANLAILAQTHVATLSLMECTSLEDLDARLAADLPGILNVDVIRVFVEGSAPLRTGETIKPASPGLADQLLGADNDFTGPASPATGHALYGQAIGSHAIVRLQTRDLNAVLALGSRDANAFVEGQGTEFLNFLARAVERRMESWVQTS
tara:strand:+ start:3286 stop:3981 length:696 start_codon:yes stop_codon:yes gene_type:complete